MQFICVSCFGRWPIFSQGGAEIDAPSTPPPPPKGHFAEGPFLAYDPDSVSCLFFFLVCSVFLILCPCLLPDIILYVWCISGVSRIVRLYRQGPVQNTAQKTDV